MEPKRLSGVKVFGSAVLRVEPDAASLQFAVSRQAKQPKDAFQAAHTAVKGVRAYLTQAGAAGDVAASRVTLTRTFEYINGRQQPTGYSAKVAFNVLLSDLDRMEELLAGVVDAGANEIDAVEFRTTKLKEYRAEARRRAVAAGREKAENYCRAAGVVLGAVTSIEDISPDVLRGSGEGHTSQDAPADDAGSERAFAPGSIVVGAAVSLVFALAPAAS
ncbi:SIMPL domain-containing protein [Gemmata sp. JC673]|uniref:SIMPL domain-containing protein n=1 Tax=Gemmata algarum TaxID=2975278 RepID=A0ABU5F3F7_9BACT|nr:SIMPL domain-containing protein [Gemmata algarum]MDY3560668.1 SIMPL domain-containing protein [Gemmata algarum]